MITLSRVSKQYPEGSRLNAIHQLDLTVRKGEMVLLTGPSGAGKSTLLRLITMEEFPDEGVVEVGRFDSRHMTRRRLPELRRRMGVIFQDFRLWREWTASENVAAALRVAGEFDPKVLRPRTHEALRRVGLAHRGRHYPAQLSGGEKQRVAIARALVVNPLVLLADEPTGNLDFDAGRAIVDLLREVNLGGTAVIVATHDRDLVDRVGGRVIRLEQGRLVDDRRTSPISAA